MRRAHDHMSPTSSCPAGSFYCPAGEQILVALAGILHVRAGRILSCPAGAQKASQFAWHPLAVLSCPLVYAPWQEAGSGIDPTKGSRCLFFEPFRRWTGCTWTIPHKALQMGQVLCTLTYQATLGCGYLLYPSLFALVSIAMSRRVGRRSWPVVGQLTALPWQSLLSPTDVRLRYALIQYPLTPCLWLVEGRTHRMECS